MLNLNSSNDCIISQSDLIDLKKIFKTKINSTRQFDKINNIFDLIKLLYKRNCINTIQCDAFLLITNKITNKDGQFNVSNYVQQLIGNQLYESNVNIYSIIRQKELQESIEYYSGNINENKKSNFIQVEAKNTTINSSAASEQIQQTFSINSPEEKYNKHRKEIHKLIAKEIGKKWRELGRELIEKEGILDDLEEGYRSNLQERTIKLLETFDENTPVEKQLQKLENALCNVRRRDLKIEIQKMFAK